jgi:hypothetical protein
MTDQNNEKPQTDKEKMQNMTEAEREAYREKKIQERIADLRKRDPFIYR